MNGRGVKGKFVKGGSLKENQKWEIEEREGAMVKEGGER